MTMRETRETAQHRKAATLRATDPLAIVDDVFLSNAQIAAQYGISTDVILRAQNAGALPYCAFGRIGSRRAARRSPRKAVLAWAASLLTSTP